MKKLLFPEMVRAKASRLLHAARVSSPHLIASLIHK